MARNSPPNPKRKRRKEEKQGVKLKVQKVVTVTSPRHPSSSSSSCSSTKASKPGYHHHHRRRHVPLLLLLLILRTLIPRVGSSGVFVSIICDDAESGCVRVLCRPGLDGYPSSPLSPIPRPGPVLVRIISFALSQSRFRACSADS